MSAQAVGMELITMEVLNYIVENALILIPVLNIIGMILKSTQKIKDNFIPLILLVFGILGAVLIMGFSGNAVIQGILVTGVSVYGNQVVKQIQKTKNESNDQ